MHRDYDLLGVARSTVCIGLYGDNPYIYGDVVVNRRCSSSGIEVGDACESGTDIACGLRSAPSFFIFMKKEVFSLRGVKKLCYSLVSSQHEPSFPGDAEVSTEGVLSSEGRSSSALNSPRRRLIKSSCTEFRKCVNISGSAVGDVRDYPDI